MEEWKYDGGEIQKKMLSKNIYIQKMICFVELGFELQILRQCSWPIRFSQECGIDKFSILSWVETPHGLFNIELKKQLGDGRSTSFWHDMWLGTKKQCSSLRGQGG